MTSLELATTFYHDQYTQSRIVAQITLFDVDTREKTIAKGCVYLLYVHYGRGSYCRLYAEVDSETNPTMQGQFVYRAQLTFDIECGQPTKAQPSVLYLNGTMYGDIIGADVVQETFREDFMELCLFLRKY